MKSALIAENLFLVTFGKSSFFLEVTELKVKMFGGLKDFNFDEMFEFLESWQDWCNVKGREFELCEPLNLRGAK